jgi:hypothetical protein
LHLEAEIIIRRLRIERPLRGQQDLIEQRQVGLVGEQMPEIQSVGARGCFAFIGKQVSPSTQRVMRQIFDFVKSTAIGGVIFFAPLRGSAHRCCQGW